jgi:surfeit locus 1 family protein
VKRSAAVVLLAALALTALTARLGFWQLDRASQKLQREQALEQRQALPPLTDEQLPSSAAAAEPQQWRHVDLRGRWLPAYTIYLENRPMRGRAGFVVVTPLSLSDGTAVLVQRGWLARDPADRTRVAEPPTPTNEQRVLGRLTLSPSRLYEFDAAVTGRIRQNVEIDAYAKESGLRLKPWAVLMVDAPAGAVQQANPDGLLREWPQPAADVHKHYGYAFQWFALAALTFCLYVWFQIVRPWRSRRATTPAS